MNRLLNLLFISLFLFATFSIYSQEVSIGSGDITSCTGFLVDTGLSAGDYSPNEDITITVCPEASETILNLDFFVFALGDGDEMSIYDGNSTSSPLIGTFSGTELQGADITSTNGCLTIHWTSDASDQGNFTISLTCGQPCIAPIASIESDQGQVLGCPGEDLSFDASNSEFFNGAEMASFLWDFGDGNTDTDSWPIAMHSYAEPGGYQVELYITDSNGCTSTNFVSLVVLIATEPIIEIEMESPVCIGSVTSYEVEGDFQPVAWEQTYSGISGGAIFIPDDQSQVFNNSIDITGFAPLEVIDETSDMDFFFINFEHSFMGDLTIQFECPSGQTITVHQQGGGGTFLGVPVDDDMSPNAEGIGYDYWWSPTATNGTWAENSSGTLPSGTYESVDPWSNLFGCPLNGIWTIQIADSWSSDNGFIFDWSIGFDPDLYPDLYNFTPSIGLDEDSSYWEMAPTITNISEDGNNLTMTYSEGGTYEYTYVLVDNFGCTYSETYEVEVVQGPVADAGPDLVVCIDNDTIQAQIIPSLPPFENYTYEWNISDNLSDPTSLTPIVEDLENTTTYVLSAMPLGNEQCITTDSVTVTVMGIPFAGDDTEVTFCTADDAIDLFTIIEGNPESGGVWLNTNNEEVSSLFDPALNQNVVLTYAFPSCEVFTEVIVNVDQLDFVLSNDTIICQNGSATIDVEVLTPNDFTIEYIWNNDFPDTNEITVSPLSTTSYSVSLNYGNGCTTDQQTSEVSFYSPLVSNITSPAMLCPNESITIEAINPSGGYGSYEYQWSSGETMLGTENSFVSSTSDDVNYCVLLTDQCESDPFEICTEIHVEQLVNPAFNSFNTSGCFPISPNFIAIESNYSEVQDEIWSFGDTSAPSYNNSSVNHDYSSPGNYTVTHTLITFNECEYTSVEPLLVHAYPYPEASFYVDNEVEVLPNTTFLFNNSSIGNSINSWNFYTDNGNLLGSSNQEKPYFTFPPNEIGSYVATLNIENEYGCPGATSRVVAVEDFAIFIPTGFTANNDGINDFFYVKGQNIDVDRFKLTIYNRWGIKVFQTTDLYEKWDGRNNILTPDGIGNEGVALKNEYYSQNEVYSYEIEVTSPGTTEMKIIKGIVTIIR